MVPKDRIKEVIVNWTAPPVQNLNLNYHKGKPLGPLAEEYMAKYAPKAQKAGGWKIPVKPAVAMESGWEED